MKSDNSFLPLSIAFLIVSILWSGSIFLFIEAPDRGTFGDMFGSVNSLFSGMAFSGVVYAIFLQRNELKIAKEELDRTKKILESQSKAVEVQNDAEIIRRFESTLFNLLSLYNEIIDDISYGTLQSKKDGRPAFRSYLDRIKNYHEQRLNYDEYYLEEGKVLGHYFRMLYRIFVFIDSSENIDRNFLCKDSKIATF